MILYDYVLSGNCYKVRLFLSLIGVECALHPIDFYPGREHKSDAFLAINPLGQLPVLDDGGEIIADAQAILVYIAERYDASGSWWRNATPLERGQMAQWLAFADGLTATASAARLHDMLGYDLDIDAARAGAHRLFRVLEDHLSSQEFKGLEWLTGAHPTIADIACFPYSALAGDGGIDLFVYPALQRWIRRITKLPAFINMPGINLPI